jgi:glycosyltransferase involved in cell wall biosynthesis
MRLLHIQKVKGIGGSERHLLELLPALAARGHDVRMLVLAAGDCRRFADPLSARGVDVVSVPTGVDVDPRPTLAVRKEIRSFAPDLVHTHLIHANVHGQLGARRNHVPAVTTAHNVDPRLRRTPILQVARRAGAAAARTIAISEHVRAFLEELRIPRPGTTRVVQYGIEAEGRRLDAFVRSEARRRYRIAADDVVVTIVARLIEGKGHVALLEAFGSVRSEVPELRLFVAGDGPLRASLEAHAARFPAGTVRFVGFLDDPRDLIGASDVLAFPTEPALGEGFGLSALEAMAAAVPVVASDVGALPEIVADGQTGLIFPGGRAEELARALGRLARDPRERARLGEAGATRARSRFSVDAMVNGTLAVYEEALRGVAAELPR